MAPTPQGRGAIGRVASTLACIAIVAGTVVPAAACARPGKALCQPPTTATTDARILSEAADERRAADDQRCGRPDDGGGTGRAADRAHGRPGRRRDALLGVPRPGHRAAVLSPNATVTSYTESMVKAWLAADELSRSEQRRQAAESRPDRPDDPRQRRQRGRDHLAQQRGRREHRPDDPDLPAHRHEDLLRLVEHDDDVRPGRGPARRVHRQRRRRRSTLDRLADERDAPGPG